MESIIRPPPLSESPGVSQTLVRPTVPLVPLYDFLADLKSVVDEDVYVAVKALGHLPALASRSKKELQRLSEDHADQRIKLEALGALARLGEPLALQKLEAIGSASHVGLPYRMEVTLILTELASPEAFAILSRLAGARSNDSELRAAAIWGLGANPSNFGNILPFVSDVDEATAVHAIVVASRGINQSNIAAALNAITDDARQSAGTVRAILASSYDFVADAIAALTTAPTGVRRQWLLYLLAASGRERCETVLRARAPQILAELEFFWSRHDENWTNRLDVADQIDFLAQQAI